VTTESAQAARSNIQAGTSSHRVASEPLSVQRKTTSSDLATAWWTKTDRPNHGCHRYKSSRKPVPWVLSSWVVQRHAHSPVIEQGRADIARRRKRGTHYLSSDPGRIAPSIWPDVIYGRHKGEDNTSAAFRTIGSTSSRSHRYPSVHVPHDLFVSLEEVYSRG
jgi:hypothetical protein